MKDVLDESPKITTNNLPSHILVNTKNIRYWLYSIIMINKFCLQTERSQSVERGIYKFKDQSLPHLNKQVLLFHL